MITTNLYVPCGKIIELPDNFYRPQTFDSLIIISNIQPVYARMGNYRKVIQPDLPLKSIIAGVSMGGKKRPAHFQTKKTLDTDVVRAYNMGLQMFATYSAEEDILSLCKKGTQLLMDNMHLRQLMRRAWTAPKGTIFKLENIEDTKGYSSSRGLIDTFLAECEDDQLTPNNIVFAIPTTYDCIYCSLTDELLSLVPYKD